MDDEGSGRSLNSMRAVKNLIRGPAIFLCLAASVGWAWGEEYLSNLRNLFGDPPSPNIIGDIEVLDYLYGPFVVQFFTGNGLDDRKYAKMYTGNPTAPRTNSATVVRFELNSVTFEFLGSPSSSWTNTQWPKSTTFIDFHPSSWKSYPSIRSS